MESSPVELANVVELKARISQLEAELKAARISATPNAQKTVNMIKTPYTGPRTAGPRRSCYECKALGHFARDCPQRAARKAQQAAAAASE